MRFRFREYQIDQSSLITAQSAACSVFGKRQKQRQLQKQPHRFRGVDTVTPYQGDALIEIDFSSRNCGFKSQLPGLASHLGVESPTLPRSRPVGLHLGKRAERPFLVNLPPGRLGAQLTWVETAFDECIGDLH
jgi:hypothetical protein